MKTMPPKKVDTSFKKGEKVKARWSGSNAFYDAKIIDVFQKTCKVEFDDGTVTNVKMGDLKSPKSEKSEKDPAKRTRSRSRSVGRPRSRSRSPGRTEKKTVAKNEKKTTKNKVEEKSKEEESPKTTNSVKKDETDSIMVKSSLTREKIGTQKEEVKSSISSVTTSNSFMSKNLFISLEKEGPAEMRLRSTRQASLRSAETSPSETKSYEKTNAIGKKDDAKYSDDEESEEEEVKVVPKGPSKIIKVLSFLATLLRIVLMPASLLFLIFACTKRQCTVLEAPQFYSKFKDLFNALKTPFPCVILFHLSICLLSLIPLGKKVVGFPFGPKKTTKEYRINGLFSLIPSLVAFGLCSYFGVYMNWGYDKIKSLSVSIALYCILYSWVLQIVSLIHGEWEKESKVPVLGSFFNGVYYNPYIFGKVDIKTTFIRAGLIGSVLINLSILLKYFLMKGYLTVPLSIAAGMSVFFVVDYFFREEKMLSTATYTSDSVGYGFILTTGFLVPVGLSVPLVYLFIFESNAHLIPHWASAIMGIFYFIGYYIYMSSGNLKHSFRSNPFSPTLSDIDSIPTSQKKRLISSKLWGFVRHPNYLGLIIMAIAWTAPCGVAHFVPYGPLVMLIIALVVRCIRIESECKEKYGPAWKNYTEKVRSRLIPYIF